MALASWFCSPAAEAGPPLISDDPNTIGQGRVEAILALASVSQNGYVAIASPTVDLTIHFRQTPGAARSDDYALAVFRTRRAHEGFLEEDGEIWSRDGELLAQSRQLALIL